MQQGMLVDSLATDAPDMYCMLVVYRVTGPLDRQAFIDAWRWVVNQHAILRTSFAWRDRPEPVQIVHDRVELPVQQYDWRGLAAADQRSRLQDLLAAEQRLGFDLERAPLIRLSLAQIADDEHQLVHAQHHILLDGTCKSLLFGEVFACYRALRSGAAPAPRPGRPYRDFIVWLRSQDLSLAERFWRRELEGFRAPTPLWPRPAAPVPPPAEAYVLHETTLDEETTGRLRQAARRARLTLSTLITGAWALTLARASGAADLVFGVTINARPPLDDIDTMMGLFINTLPVRVRLQPEMTVAAWLDRLQATQAAVRDWDFTPLSRIVRWSAVPKGQPLFESIVVVENNPGYDGRGETFDDITIEIVQPVTRNSLPLTVRAIPAASLIVQLLYDARRFPPEAVHDAAADMAVALGAFAAGLDTPVRDVLHALEIRGAERARQTAAAYQTNLAARLRGTRLVNRRVPAAIPDPDRQDTGTP